MDDNILEYYLKKKPRDNLVLEKFFGEFLRTRVYVLLPEPIKDTIIDEDGNITLNVGMDVAITNRITQDGMKYVPVYTSMAELQKSLYEQDKHYMAPFGYDILTLCRGEHFIVNDHSPFHLIITPQETENIFTHFGIKKNILEEETYFLLGLPEVDPVGLKEEIVNLFKLYPEIEFSYLCLALNEKKQEYSYIVAIKCDDYKNYDEIISRAGIAASGWLPKGYFIDFCNYSEGNDAIAIDVEQYGSCVYEREG